MSDIDADDEAVDEREHDRGPMTVRDLLHVICGLAPNLDSVVSGVTDNGANRIAFAVIGAHSHPGIGDEDPGDLFLQLDFPLAWDAQTSEPKSAGVLVLDGQDE